MYKCGKCNLRGCSNGNMDKLDELIVDMKNKYLRPDK